MAGPSLQLGVSAAGQETLAGLNAELAALRGNLSALKAGKPDLSGLTGANQQLQLLRKDIANGNAGLQTAFADLAETIKGGFEKAAGASRAGGAAIAAGVDGQATAVEKAAQRIKNTSALMTTAYAEKAAAETAAAERAAQRIQNTSAIWTAKYSEKLAAEEAISDRFAQRIQNTSAIWTVKYNEKVAAEEAASAQAAQRLKNTSAIWATKYAEKAAAEAAAVKRAADIEVAALEAAAERVARAEAAYQIKTAAAQAAAQRGARSQLDQGITAAAVTQNFGPTATGAAQAAESLNALTAAHQRAGLAAVDHVPKVKGLQQAMTDARSAVRGLADGIGGLSTMFASLGPLLAGAAISNAFVQTVKQGAAVGQILEVIKQLSEETDQSVGMLRSTLLDLASNGPQGPKEIAEAMKALSLAGLNAAEVASSVKSALTLSIVGEMPAQKAAESLVAISTAYGYAAGDFNRVNDVIAKTAAVSMSSVEGMTQSFRVASTVAQQYGVRLEDTATQLGLLANLGIRNQQAGTAVTQFYTGLAANTKKGHDALTMIVGDVGRLRDEFGNMKPAVQIIDMLNDGLKRFSGAAQASLLSAVYNNRGARAGISNILASRLPAYDANTGKVREAVDENGQLTGKLVMQWEDMAKKVTESYGFAAIAMANLSLTAENQMKSVMSALQGAFVDAFKDIEPTVLAVSQQLRNAFNGESFRSTLSSITISISNLIVMLVEHANALKIAAEAWLIYKAATMSAALFSGIAAGVAALGAAFTAVGAASGVAATGFAVVRAAMGPIGLLLGGLAAAWALYKSSSVSASITAADTSALKSGQIIEALDKETARLKARNDMIEAGTSAREADIRIAALQAQQDMAKSRSGAMTEQDTKISEAQKQLDSIRSQAEAAANAPVSQRDTYQSRARGAVSVSARLELANQQAAAEAKVNNLLEQRRLLNRGLTQDQQNVTDATNRQISEAKRAADLEEKNRKRNGLNTGGTDPYEKTKDTEVARASSELSALKTIYTAQEAARKTHYDQLDKIEKIRHDSGQTSDIQYQIEQTGREQAYYGERIGALNKFIADSQHALDVMRSRPDKGRDQKAEAEEAKEQIRLRGLRSELELAQQITVEQQKARDFKQEADTSKFISQQMQALVQAEQQNDLKVAQLSLTKEQAQVENARLAAAGKFTDEIRKQQVALTAAQQYLTTLKGTGNASAANDFAGAQDETRITAATAKVNELQGSVTRLEETAKTAGMFSAQKTADRMVPAWQQLLTDWGNVQQRMTEMYDATVTGFVSQGEVAFDRLAKTGKLSATELLDTIRDILIKNMYQSTVAPAMAALGKQVAEGLFNARPQATALSPTDLAAQKTAASLDTMNNVGVQPTTSALGRLIQAIESASQALLSMSASNGGYASAGAIGSLFGNNTGNGSAGWTGNTVGDTSGSVGGQVVTLFAKGSAFTNRVYSQPTRFASGGAMGEMGEAGPEAVMPLKRGPDGSLGVAYHGAGQQQAAPVSVVIENHSGGQVSKRETQRGDGSKEIRFIIDAAVNEVENSITSGGRIGTAIESTYGSNRAAGLPRR